MYALTMAYLTQAAARLGQFLWAPLAHTPWSSVRDFWLGQIFSDRFVIVYFLPLVPILLLLPPRRLRQGIIFTGLMFIVYLFGALYAGFWLLTCIAFHRFAERFAVECKRTDVLRIGPPLAAIAMVGAWFIVTQKLDGLRLPDAINGWLLVHTPWVFPLGARGLAWEPQFQRLYSTHDGQEVSALFHALFFDAHYIGTAYLVVRLLHYFSEIKRDTLPRARRTLLNFLAYVCYAPALIQGPIERFAIFQDELDTCPTRRSWRNLPPALARIGLGLVKSLIATWYFLPVLTEPLGIGHDNTYYKHPERIESFGLLYFGVFLQIFCLYLQFSGYCDVSAGIARLLGYRQIENFRGPWLATSMRDFWHRWHISLSLMLRDYVYIPLGGNRRHVTLNLCVTFFLCGLWHRLIPQVGIWGIVMGLMLAVNQLWVRWMKRLDETPTGWLAALRRAGVKLRPLPQIGAWLLTMHAFVFSLLIFFGGSGAILVIREILRRIWTWHG